MKQKHKKKPHEHQKIALQRIRRLFELANNRREESKLSEEVSAEASAWQAKKDGKQLNLSLADRYAALARKIAMKYKVKIPRELKRRLCKHCHAFLVPGNNCRVRLRNQMAVYFCSRCRKFTRIPYRKEIKKRRKIFRVLP